MGSYKGLNAWQLKIIMSILMLLDHLYLYIFRDELLFVHYFTRIVAPVFAFLLTESMVYTRNRERYIARLFGFGIFMAAGNAVLTFLTGVKIPNNVFLPLASGAMLIYCIDKAREGKNIPLWLSITALSFYASFSFEGRYQIPLAAVIFYYLRTNRLLMYMCYVLIAGFPYAAAYFSTGRLQTQFYMVCAIFPIMLYNGRRGSDTAMSKYFFYVFYPLHIWIIVILKHVFFIF